MNFTEILETCFIFFFGSAIGSFLGVVIDRLPSGESIIKGRSQCDYCKKSLSLPDLVPVFSFLFLGGRCRFCHKKLTLFYPLIEILTGALFVFIFFYTNSMVNLDTLYYLLIVSILLLIFFIDLKYGIIPFPLVAFATVVTLGYFLLQTHYLLLNNFLAGIGAFLFFFVLFLATRRRGMGFGDVIYAFFMGFILGLPKIVLGLYIAFVGGAIIGLILIFLKRKKLHGSTMPFGPFLVAGTFIGLFWGDQLVSLTIELLQFTIK